ncbi:hypothetical protein IKF76_01465 [Candidatus Saccharibacteria bacterium]|nr:hypothetical protein [Candidatus Saccharibacteria bacterium]
MKLVEVMPLVKIHRPFDAHAEHMKSARVSNSMFKYYNLIQPNRAVAEMNKLTRHLVNQDEFLVITLIGSTYLEKGTRLDALRPLGFFHAAFDFGHDTPETDAFHDCLVNMTKQEPAGVLREMLYGMAPSWKLEYGGAKIVLCRKTAVLPEYLRGKWLPVIHRPDNSKRAEKIRYEASSVQMAAMA